jgi:lipid-binding SYLF domain-containing protein
MTHWVCKLAAACAAVFLLLAAPALSYADTGTVRITVAKAGFIFGVGGGSGVLHFKGKTYRLSIGGISAGTIGVAKAELVGTVHNLRAAEDIVGTYTAVSASIAVAGGGKAARLQNAKGVVLELHGKQVGLELSLDLSGLAVSLE